MYRNTPQRGRLEDRKNQPSQFLMILIGVGVAVVVTVIGNLILYLAELFRARPMG